MVDSHSSLISRFVKQCAKHARSIRAFSRLIASFSLEGHRGLVDCLNDAPKLFPNSCGSFVVFFFTQGPTGACRPAMPPLGWNRCPPSSQGTGFLDAKALQELTAEHNLSSEESSPSGDNRGTTYSHLAALRVEDKLAPRWVFSFPKAEAGYGPVEPGNRCECVVLVHPKYNNIADA